MLNSIPPDDCNLSSEGSSKLISMEDKNATVCDKVWENWSYLYNNVLKSTFVAHESYSCIT